MFVKQLSTAFISPSEIAVLSILKKCSRENVYQNNKLGGYGISAAE